MAINTQEMMRILDSIARERNIDRSILVKDLELAMVSAARKYYNTLDTEEFACTLDPISGQFNLTRHGEPLDMPPEAFGRIAAQTFKQVMIQKFRDDERSSIFEEFSKRIGEIVTGTAQRYEGGALVVTIDRAEAFMPRSEQIPGEQFNAGDRVRCMILDVRDAGSQVKIVRMPTVDVSLEALAERTDGMSP
ncbi:MAG TPA: NusA N-terminal domain-containing protein, partial [Phycisphaerales bacterium]|nr:NusA N-terminal domain-containing protein [Phycisphaerales bacterium]